jgi:hypothetical protein
MVSFKTKNPDLGIFWRTLEWKMMLYILVVSNILVPFCIFYGHFVIIGILFPAFDILYQEKSGNPVAERQTNLRFE